MSELLNVQVNAQKGSLKDTSGIYASSCKPCAMKMKQRNKQCVCKMLLMEKGVYRAAMDIKSTSFKSMTVDTMKVLFV